MRILHYYPADQPMVSQYVRLLTENMGIETENHTATEADQAHTLLQGGSYDLFHLHGCWRNSARTIVALALRQGARIVVTPHGQLEPWVRNENRWKEKLPKELFYQRSIIRNAYAVVVQGRMEQECMEKLGWNHRCIIIRNCLMTQSITPKEMARQTVKLYRRILDSNPWQLMTEDTRQALRNILKAGITGDAHWLVGDERFCKHDIQWRELLNYASQEIISTTVERGIRILGLTTPDTELSQAVPFMPDGYTAPESIESAIGMQYAHENDRLLATFRHLKKLASDKQLAIRHLVELDKELRQHTCEEDKLKETLQERRLLPLAQRLMKLMNEMTGLSEGFMPVNPLSDRGTRTLRRTVERHLEIHC